MAEDKQNQLSIDLGDSTLRGKEAVQEWMATANVEPLGAEGNWAARPGRAPKKGTW